MKILKKYANGGTEPHNSFEMRRGKKIKQKEMRGKERGNPFNTGTSKRKPITKMDLEGMPASPPGTIRKPWKFKGKVRKYANGGTTDDRTERRGVMRDRREGAREDRMRGRARMQKQTIMERSRAERQQARKNRPTPTSSPGWPKMEFGGVGKEKPTRFERKFAKQRDKYDKDVKKGRTQEAPHERTFKFRPDKQSIFKKRKKYNVEHAHELEDRKGRESERIANDDMLVNTKQRGGLKQTRIIRDAEPRTTTPNTPNTRDESGKLRKRGRIKMKRKEKGRKFQGGGLHQYSRKTKSNPFSVKTKVNEAFQSEHDKRQMDMGRREQQMKEKVKRSNMDPAKQRAFNRKMRDLKQRRESIRSPRMR